MDPVADSLPADGLHLKIMSFNIRRGTKSDGKNHWMYRRKLVNKVLIQYRPDILGLQEALDFQMAEISAMLPGYANIGTGNLDDSKGMHNAIFSMRHGLTSLRREPSGFQTRPISRDQKDGET